METNRLSRREFLFGGGVRRRYDVALSAGGLVAAPGRGVGETSAPGWRR